MLSVQMPTSVFYTVSELLSNVHGDVLFTFSEAGLLASGTNQNGTQIFSANVLPDGFEYIENDSGEQETFTIPNQFLEFFNEREAIDDFIEIRYKNTDDEDVVTIDGQEYIADSLTGDEENHVGVSAQDGVGLQTNGVELKEGVEWTNKTGDIIALSYNTKENDRMGDLELTSLTENEAMSNAGGNRQQLIGNNTGLSGSAQYGVPAAELNQPEEIEEMDNVYLSIDAVNNILQTDVFQGNVVIGISGAEEPVVFESMFTEDNFRAVNEADTTGSEDNQQINEQNTQSDEPGDIIVSLQSVVFPLKKDVIEQ